MGFLVESFWLPSAVKAHLLTTDSPIVSGQAQTADCVYTLVTDPCRVKHHISESWKDKKSRVREIRNEDWALRLLAAPVVAGEQELTVNSLFALAFFSLCGCGQRLRAPDSCFSFRCRSCCWLRQPAATL
jgi:hypothetical protein